MSPTTSTPTHTPTKDPTISKPTDNPTEKPTTSIPTEKPTISNPTENPSVSPTQFVSIQRQMNEFRRVQTEQQMFIDEIMKDNERLSQKVVELEQRNIDLNDSLDSHLSSANAVQITIRDSLMVNEQLETKTFEIDDSIKEIVQNLDTLNKKDLCTWEGTACSCAADTGLRNEGYVIVATSCVDGVLVSQPSVISFMTTDGDAMCPSEHNLCDVWSVDYSMDAYDPNCPRNTVENGGALIPHSDMVDGEVEENVVCPTGFRGSVNVECNDGIVTVQDDLHCLEIFSVSVLITTSEKQQIVSWIGIGDLSWEMCYRKSIDPNSSETMHDYCDNTGATVTVVLLSTGKLIGGYAPEGTWNSCGCYHTTSDGFLFSLTNNYKHEFSQNSHKGVYSRY
eukprot:UN02428